MGTLFAAVLGIYGLAVSIYIISENRRPQATLAWILVFILAPGLGVLIYVLFGRDRKAFSKQSKLLMQDLRPSAQPLLSGLLSRQDAAIGQLEVLGPIHRKLMKLVRRNSQSALTMANRVTIQQDASEFYRQLIEDMRRARHSIHHQYFIWRSDDFTEELKAVLTAKAQEGVEVRILYDPLGSINLRRSYVKQMQSAGIRMHPTSPLYRLHTLSYRNHRKITVVDGTIGYTGGMNIGQEHLDGGKGFDAWRDTQVRMVGEAAAVLQAVFMVDWYNAVKEDLFHPAYFPEDASAERPAAVPAEDDVPVQILTSGPDSEWAAIRQMYANMIALAQHRVFLQSPYFVLDATIAEALRSAALSGIDVRVMLSARSSGNVLPEWAGNTYVADIVKAGVRVYMYQRGYLHAKTISVDSQFCSIGTTNIDIRSFSINYEINAVIYDATLAAQLERDFERDLVQCAEFEIAEYRARGRFVRFRDSCARLLSPLL